MKERDVKNTMADKIKALLEERNMSQKELAAETKVTEAAISNYISGEREPRGAILLNIAKALGATTDFLLNTELGMHDAINEQTQSVNQACDIIARHANTMTYEQKEKLLRSLLGSGKGE